ncbi:MAG TPA: LAGLIDADG family homing endonuclease [Mycoplasmatales bacterium]|nr:LAGLIDADG family homing endonuclease [Mycoplasmatales bacterium]
MFEDHNPLKGNTMGSRLDVENAYIAGFLDGDGSIMLQVKKRSDCRSGYRFMATICLYQDTRHDKNLFWIRDLLNIGYISKRKDGITEMRINGFFSVYSVLCDLLPYIRFKKFQAEKMIEACRILNSRLHTISKDNLLALTEIVFLIQNENYKSSKRKNKEEILKMLNLTP